MGLGVAAIPNLDKLDWYTKKKTFVCIYIASGCPGIHKRILRWGKVQS